MNLTDKDTVVALMASSRTADEWDANCDRVKVANGGYPNWWHSAIKVSGVMRKTAAKWGGDDQLHISTF